MTLSGPIGVMGPPGFSRPMSSAVRAASVAVGLDRIAWQSRQEQIRNMPTGDTLAFAHQPHWLRGNPDHIWVEVGQ